MNGMERRKWVQLGMRGTGKRKSEMPFERIEKDKRGLHDRQASAKDAKIKGCDWVVHIRISM